MKLDDKKREQIAAVQHEIWAHWMAYLFSISPENEDGSVTISAGNMERWNRQVATPYVFLTEEEKDSDREQADKVIAVI